VCKSGLRQLLLANLWPTGLYLLRQGDWVCAAEEIVERTRNAGSEPSGRGGAAAEKVKAAALEGEHFLPMKNIAGTAEGWRCNHTNR
jgi:hypothetical protein